LLLMREELGNLLSQVDTQREINHQRGDSDSLDDLVELLSQVDVQERRLSDLGGTLEEPDQTPVVEETDQTPHTGNSEVTGLSSSNLQMDSCEFSTPKVDTTPAVNRHLTFSDLTKKISPIREESPGNNGPGQELMDKMLLSSSWIDSLDLGLLLEEQAKEQEANEKDIQFAEEAINKDTLFEQSVFEQELEKETIEPTKDDGLPSDSTWRIGNITPKETIPDNHSALEWLSETSSVIMDPFSPMPSEKRHVNHNQVLKEVARTTVQVDLKVISFIQK
jgi:hypothetical protein